MACGNGTLLSGRVDSRRRHEHRSAVFIACLVEQVLLRTQWVVIYLVGALLVECLALRWRPVGAGNSIAVCSLAGSLIVIQPFVGMTVLSRVMRIVATAAALLLLAKDDVHGAAFFVGALLGLAVFGWRRDRPRASCPCP